MESAGGFYSGAQSGRIRLHAIPRDIQNIPKYGDLPCAGSHLGWMIQLSSAWGLVKPFVLGVSGRVQDSKPV